ncbi:MAG: ATP-binding protein [Candidatus Thiosymbion ectosymbiont of Robbea hypermnestra]|nr:ATP-binding protein [Candidatus Thiosymbion ectosymbiont of Robbea hypermnestra]
MFLRIAAPQVERALARQAAVALVGPRQVGKTTLALMIGEEKDALYLDLEDPDDRSRLANPALFFEHAEDRLVILDEIHRMPELFQILRGVIDQGRRRRKGKGRFLILGSASIDLLRQSGETLAGRIAYINLGPLSPLETGNDRPARERLWLRGGFPDSYLAADDGESLALRKDLVRTYLERDVPMFGPRIPATTLGRLWTMLAHRQGTLLNASELARALEVSTQSVTRYIDLLCDLLLVRRLPPFHRNVGKRLVKSPKIYVRDSGLVHALLGIENPEQLAGHPVVGASWEGFVLESLLSVLPWRSSAFFYRTRVGAEIDLVLEHGDGALWAIEIKRALAAKAERGFHIACEDTAPARAFLVHAGDDRYPISETLEGIGISQLMEELRRLG